MIELLAIPVMAGLSRLHGADNGVPKVVESLLFGGAAYLIYHLAHDVKLAGWETLIAVVAIALVALGKSIGHRNGLLMIMHRKLTWLGMWTFWRKACVMCLPFVLLAFYLGDMNSVWIMALASLQLVVAYTVGFYAHIYLRPLSDNKHWKFYTTGSVIGEILGGALFCLALIL